MYVLSYWVELRDIEYGDAEKCISAL